MNNVNNAVADSLKNILQSKYSLADSEEDGFRDEDEAEDEYPRNAYAMTNPMLGNQKSVFG